MTLKIPTLAFALLSINLARADTFSLVAGGGTGTGGTPAVESKLQEPFGIEFDKAGNAYLAELSGGRLMKIDSKGVLTVVAGALGKKGYSGDGGPASAALFNGMHNLAVHPSGDIYLADTFNSTVRKIDAKTGVITTVAGTGKKGFSGDGGPGPKAEFNGTFCVTLDRKGEQLYITDLGNKRIRKLDLASGIVTTVAGNGKGGVPADGAVAVEAPLSDPRAAAPDGKGNLYILERGGNALRVVDAQGKIRTVVGTGKSGGAGDGGPALSATLSGPKHLCVDPDDNVIIADAESQLVRKFVVAEGKIVRIAGTGKKGKGAVGQDPTKTELARPHGVTVGPDGKLYIVDSYNERVLRIEK